MTSKQFLAEGRLKPHRTGPKEVRDLLRVAQRDLKDASVTEISVDRRFIIAYQAAFQLATIVLAASGFRTAGTGHHWVTFKILPELSVQASRIFLTILISGEPSETSLIMTGSHAAARDHCGSPGDPPDPRAFGAPDRGVRSLPLPAASEPHR